MHNEIFERYKPLALSLADKAFMSLYNADLITYSDRPDIYQEFLIKLLEVSKKIEVGKYKEGQITSFISKSLNNFRKDFISKYFLRNEEYCDEDIFVQKEHLKEVEMEILKQELLDKLNNSKKVKFKKLEKEIILEILKNKSPKDIYKKRCISRAYFYKLYNGAVEKLKITFAEG